MNFFYYKKMQKWTIYLVVFQRHILSFEINSPANVFILFLIIVSFACIIENQ